VKTRIAITICLGAVLVAPAFAAQKKKAPKRGAADRAKVTATAPLDAEAINSAATMESVGPGAAGSAVVRAQILLDRAHFSPGEIDGRYGDNLRVAITGYQTDRKLNVTGVVDAETWKVLNQDPAPVLVPYTVTEEDAKGPFVKIPSKMEAKAKLPALGFTSAQEALAEKFHMDPKLLADLNRGRDLSKAGEQILVANVARSAVVPAARVTVSKSRRTVTAFGPDGKTLAQYPATMGSEHDPLPIGNWTITVIQRNPVFNYNPDLFWDAEPGENKARIPAGPNNPVGLVWIGLSKEHYGIHGTPEPGAIGHTESHGCIRLTNWDAMELASMVKLKQPVVLEE
jgi:lipoprotein-anchoring transpeptidase ErfK/SrfK